jgi:hypothetical protein
MMAEHAKNHDEIVEPEESSAATQQDNLIRRDWKLGTGIPCFMILTIVGEPHHAYAAPALSPHLLAYLMQKKKLKLIQ